MTRRVRSLRLVLAWCCGAGGLGAHEEWNNLHITFNAPGTPPSAASQGPDLYGAFNSASARRTL